MANAETSINKITPIKLLMLAWAHTLRKIETG